MAIIWQLCNTNLSCLSQRCAVEAVDQQGATALHVAAERGGVEVCWTLLQRTGCRMLHQKNHSGLTPLDLCKQGKTFRWICCFQKYLKKKKKHWRAGHCVLTPHHASKIYNTVAFTIFSWDCIADGYTVCFSLDISSSPNYWVDTLKSHYITSPLSLVVNITVWFLSFTSTRARMIIMMITMVMVLVEL